uniref:Uncharacterized protein n=1 Tax=Anguilla anguilla TaxID=7936 RepID=A0A0E9S3H2_ANGAN
MVLVIFSFKKTTFRLFILLKISQCQYRGSSVINYIQVRRAVNLKMFLKTVVN